MNQRAYDRVVLGGFSLVMADSLLRLYGWPSYVLVVPEMCPLWLRSALLFLILGYETWKSREPFRSVSLVLLILALISYAFSVMRWEDDLLFLAAFISYFFANMYWQGAFLMSVVSVLGLTVLLMAGLGKQVPHRGWRLFLLSYPLVRALTTPLFGFYLPVSAQLLDLCLLAIPLVALLARCVWQRRDTSVERK